MRNYRLYLKDIFEAMIAAQAFVEGMDFDAFVAAEKSVLHYLKPEEADAKTWNSEAKKDERHEQASEESASSR